MILNTYIYVFPRYYFDIQDKICNFAHNMATLFSIITITFNAESEIGPTLDSVKSQTFNDFEHIIIDGASTDNTLSVISHKSIHNAKIISEPDKGLYDAMNKGIKNANGKYLIFLNAGDSFHSKDTLQLYANAANTNPDIIYGDTILVNTNREFVGPRHLSAPKNLSFKSFINGMLVCHQAFVAKREIVSFYNLNYRFSADYEWCLKCLQKTSPERCINLNTITIDYLIDGLTDKNHKKSLRERYQIMCNYYGIVPTILKHISFIPRYILKKINCH